MSWVAPGPGALPDRSDPMWASSNGDFPTFDARPTQTPTTSKAGSSRRNLSACDPVFPVPHWTTRNSRGHGVSDQSEAGRALVVLVRMSAPWGVRVSASSDIMR